jgi:hypothetical protein
MNASICNNGFLSALAMREVEGFIDTVADRNTLLQWWRLLFIGVAPSDIPANFSDASYEPVFLAVLARNIPRRELECGLSDSEVAARITPQKQILNGFNQKEG